MSVRYVCLLFTLLAVSDAARILGVFQYTCKSHYILGSTLLQELAARGHEVTMISPFELEPPVKNYKDVVLNGILSHREYNMRIVVNPNTTLLEKVSASITATRTMSRLVLGNENLQNFLKTAPKHDLVIQMYAFNEAMLGIGYKLNATTIAFSVVDSTFVNYLAGNPSPYAYIPNLILSYTNNMTFYERLINTLVSILFDLTLHYLNIPFQQSLLDEFFPGAPKITELMDNVDLTLINTHYSTESPRPYLPNVIQIGGFHLEHKEPMPDDLKQYLDKSVNGVILFSFGTNVKSSNLDKDTISAILKAFGKSKYDILWKFEGDDLPDKPKNVRLTKWVPQRTVLAHPKLKAFITHGGLGSTVESVYYGVPMICIPFFGDQSKNAAESVRNGYGIILQSDDITEDTLTAALKEITENPIYAEKVKLRSDLYRNQPVNPMDKAVFWVEHVIKYGHAKHLKSRAHVIPWYQYMLLDVFAFITVVLLMIVGGLYYLMKMLLNLCCGSKTVKSSNKKVKSS